MQQELFIAILAGLGAMLGWGFADFFAKKTIDEVGGSIVILVWAHIFGTFILALVAWYLLIVQGNQLTAPNDLGGWGALLFFGALQAVVYLLAYEGFGKGQLAVLNPVFASYAGLAALVSIILFGELISTNLVVALAMIFTGILLLNIDTQALRNKRLNLMHVPGLKEVGFAALLAAFWQLYWDKLVGGKDWVLYTLLMYTFMTLTAFAVAKIKKRNIRQMRKMWPTIDRKDYPKKIFDYEFKIIKGVYHGRKRILKFHLVTAKVINDIRFIVTFYLPVDNDTKNFCDKLKANLTTQ